MKTNTASFWGRFIGAFCGFLFLRFPGAVVGYFIGWVMDQGVLHATIFMSHNMQDAVDAWQRAYQATPRPTTVNALLAAYEVLGVAPQVSDQDLKTAYRRLMSQHHPDKLAAQGLSPKMVKEATEKTQIIKKSYELIKKARESAQERA